MNKQPTDSSPLLSAKVQTSDSVSGSGSVIGTYGFVEITKTKFSTVLPSEYDSFCKTVVQADRKDDYFTIDFGDGTGLVFPGMSVQTASYCKLGCVSKVDSAIFGGFSASASCKKSIQSCLNRL